MAACWIEKLSQYALVPRLVDRSSNVYEVYSLHSAVVPPKQDAILQTGLKVVGQQCTTALVIGQLACPTKNAMEIKQAFISQNDEIVCKTVNRDERECRVGQYSLLSRVVFLQSYDGQYDLVDQLDETERGSKGYGSTGIH